MKKVFVILLNWNNWSDTQECLESLEKVGYLNFEVVIVDNNSSEDERGKIRHYGSKAIFNSENLGFAGGNNVGIKYALSHGADYVMLLNNDTIIAPDFLTKLVKASENDKTLGILGSRIYKYGTNEVVFNGGKVNKCLTSAEHTNSTGTVPVEFDKDNTQQVAEADYITGAAMLIKREVIELVGLMREDYFLYYEDVDWCLRAIKAEYKCVVVPRSHVWHKVSSTNKEGSSSYIYYHTRNGLMLAKFNGNIFQRAAAYILGFWILLKQIPKFLIPGKKIWARAMTHGVVDFYKNKYGKYAYRD